MRRKVHMATAAAALLGAAALTAMIPAAARAQAAPPATDAAPAVRDCAEHPDAGQVAFAPATVEFAAQAGDVAPTPRSATDAPSADAPAPHAPATEAAHIPAPDVARLP